MNEYDLLARIVRDCKAILGDELTGVYAHGSLAFGCFRWSKSDIDFLVVAEREPSLEQKMALIRALLALDPCAPPKGLEMSLVLADDCRRFAHPTPFALHFSNMHKARCQTDLADYCRTMNGLDPDLAAHFTVTRAVGLTLYGPPARDLFAEVPREAYLDSIRADVLGALEEAEAQPVYAALTLCRVLGYLREGRVLSKAQGGAWGLKTLPERHHAVLRAALESYGSDEAFRGDIAAVRALADDRRDEILRA